VTGRWRLPAEMARNAAGVTEPAPTRDAATVVLLRDATDGPGVQVYLLRRVASMVFAAGMHVFPGGAVDQRDATLPAEAWSGPPPREWRRPLSADEPLARALVAAAVRETFEESGVLLAGPRETGDELRLVTDTTGEGWEADRQALVAGTLSLRDLLDRRGLVLRADLLRAWAHWITPEAEPRRYDTRFFVAALPAGQAPREVGGEADRAVWLRPQEALDWHANGELALLPPTAFTLAELASYDTVAEVLSAGARRDIRPVLPRIVMSGPEEAEVLLPGEEGYAG
jgi:8-oxo-dGTP pyrophosphatase MutT (NUDIX family)